MATTLSFGDADSWGQVDLAGQYAFELYLMRYAETVLTNAGYEDGEDFGISKDSQNGTETSVWIDVLEDGSETKKFGEVKALLETHGLETEVRESPPFLTVYGVPVDADALFTGDAVKQKGETRTFTVIATQQYLDDHKVPGVDTHASYAWLENQHHRASKEWLAVHSAVTDQTNLYKHHADRGYFETMADDVELLRLPRPYETPGEDGYDEFTDSISGFLGR